MLFHPTTTVDILRGSTVDSYGDDDDTAVVVSPGVPASLTERSKLATLRGSGEPRVIRYTVCRLPATACVAQGDRVRDSDGVIYTVDSVTRGASFVGGRADLRLDLRRVT